MKQPFPHFRSSSRAGFTLVELLVVIGIIAILAGAVLAAGNSAINSSKRAKAAAMASQIQTAVMNYYTEYSVYPVPANTTTDYVITDATSDKTNWGNLIEALCGNIKPTNGATSTETAISNTRSVAFLSLKSTDVDANDAPLNALPYNKTSNPYFNIAMDSDYDGVLGAGTSAANLPNIAAATIGTAPATSGGTSTAGVAVWANCNTGSGTNPNFWVHTY